MPTLNGNDMQYTWADGTAEDSSVATGKIVRGRYSVRRPVHDDSPINTDNTQFVAGTASTQGWFDVHVDSAAPGLPPPSGSTGTLTIARNKDATSTNKLSGTAFLHGGDLSFTSLNGAPIQVYRYFFHFTGAVTHTNPS